MRHLITLITFLMVLLIPSFAQTNTTSDEINSTKSLELLEQLKSAMNNVAISSDDFAYELNTSRSAAQVSQNVLKIMPLGDSITFQASTVHLPDDRTGENYDIYRHGYRNYLWYRLTDAGYNVNFVGSRRTGESVVPHFDGDNDGYPGITNYELADYMYTLLQRNQPDVILLHIGTNDPSTNTSGTNSILNEIDRYERNYGHHIKVIVALIIKRLDGYSSTISGYNSNLRDLVNYRKNNGDDLVLVNMYSGAGIDYSTDMIDNLHPNNTGYYKMARVWFHALEGLFVTKPAKATGLHISSLTDHSAYLTWNDNANNEDSYKIYDMHTHIATLSANSTSYHIENLSGDHTYTYYVVPYNDAGHTNSDPITFTTLPSIPNKPTSFRVSNVTSHSAILRWSDNSNNETGFKIYQNGVRIAKLGANTTSYAPTNLQSNTHYNYKIVSYNTHGSSTVVSLDITTKDDYAWLIPVHYIILN